MSTPPARRKAPTTPEASGRKARAALTQARQNLEVSTKLAAQGEYPYAYRALIESAEELARVIAYLCVWIGSWTFDPAQAKVADYVNEDDLFRHGRKHATFASLELSAGTIELVISSLQKGPTDLKRLQDELAPAESGEQTDEEALATLEKLLPSFPVVVESFPFWEDARQAAAYSGPDRRGNETAPGTQQDYDRVAPLVRRRLESLESWIPEMLDVPDPEKVRALFREIGLLEKAGKAQPSRKPAR